MTQALPSPCRFRLAAAPFLRTSLLALSVCCPPAVAQEPVSAELQQYTEQMIQLAQIEAAANDKVGGKWRGVPRIKGTASITFRTTVDEADLMPSETGYRTEDVTVRFELVRDDTHGGDGLLWRSREVSLAGGISTQNNFDSGGSRVNMSEDARFRTTADDGQDMSLSLTTVDGTWVISTPASTNETYTLTRSWNGQNYQNGEWVAVNETQIEQHDSVQSLAFSGTIGDLPGITVASVQDEGTVGDRETRRYQKRARIEFWPDYDDYTLEVRIDDYANWRPLGQIAEPGKSGNNLTAKATVLPKGDAAAPQVRAISFQLLDVSREPGVCLNWPLGASDREPDLRLAALPDSPGSLSDEDQHFEVTQPQVDALHRPFALAQIDSYDFGARATLRVTAELLDGRELVGEFVAEDGEAAQDLIRLPNMTGPDWIAAAWKEQNGVSELPDQDDSENKPVGDGFKGDGYTLYEEYRGWIENGRHIEGDPKTKDFFVLDESEGLYIGGARKFGRVTGLKVHYRFAKNEFSRVMNRNHDAGPHLVDQHGVIIRTQPGQVGYAEARGGPSNPAKIRFVAMMEDSAQFSPEYLAATVAHELGHCVNVYHHGQSDKVVFWSLKNGQLFETGVNADGAAVGPIRLLMENDTDLTATWIKHLQQLASGSGWTIALGVSGGEHSGSETCVMRYDCAQAYAGKKIPLVRYYGFKEPVGGEMCQGSAGTGINDTDHPPQSRYGDAAEGFGNCLHQIHVSDALPAPGRD